MPPPNQQSPLRSNEIVNITDEHPSSQSSCTTTTHSVESAIPSLPPNTPRTPLETLPATSQNTQAHAPTKFVIPGTRTLTLIVTIALGIGAMAGMSIQIGQGNKSFDVALWTACVDHPEIQTSNVCRGFMGKSFDDLEKRDMQIAREKLCSNIKQRDLKSASVDDISKSSNISSPKSERNLVIKKLASIKTLIFQSLIPVYHFFLSLIWWARKFFSLFSFMFWWLSQMLCYNFVDTLLWTSSQKTLARILPAFLPPTIVSGSFIMVIVSALQSYWYSCGFWQNLAWAFTFRAICFLYGYDVWAIQTIEERRRLQPVESQASTFRRTRYEKLDRGEAKETMVRRQGKS